MQLNAVESIMLVVFILRETSILILCIFIAILI